MGWMKEAGLALFFCLSVTLSLTAGCSSGAHSTASRPADSSQPIYLAQTTCWDTESCCILRDPLSAANRCAVRPDRITEIIHRARELHGPIQLGARFKEDAQAKEDAEFAEAAEAEEEAAPEPPDCQGQNHHVISRPIAKVLARHKTLRGLYEPRDERYVAKAKDKESHCGYQKWHRDVDLEVIQWLRRTDEATPEQFMNMLREIYRRKDILKRFPNGFGPAT
jgi:hypothetical protein